MQKENKASETSNGRGTLPRISGYKILHDVGHGSNACVYAAKCLKTGKMVALKVLDKHSQSKEGLRRTKQEIRLLSELDHPNIIKFHEAFDHRDKRFIVMEYAAGGDLFELLYGTERNPSQTIMKESKARKIFVQVLSAIRHAHRRGIVHRDIKPENIFLDSTGTVKVGDFGLAMRYKPGTAVRQPVGSLLYASPEVLQHQPYVGPELDVWGLGILLYEMLCGTPPFSAESEQETCDKILRGDYAIPKFLSSDAQHLISSMIKISKLRASISDIVKHPWCRDEFARLELAYRSKRRDRESGDMLAKRDPRKLSKEECCHREELGDCCFESGDCAMWSPGVSPVKQHAAWPVTGKVSAGPEDELSEPESLDEFNDADDFSDPDSDEESDYEGCAGSDAENSTDESGSDILISPRGDRPSASKKWSLTKGLSKAFKNCKLDLPVQNKPPPIRRCGVADLKSPRSSSSPALHY